MGARFLEQNRKKLTMAVRMIAEGSKFLNRSCADCLTFMWSADGLEGIGKNSRKKYRSAQACLDAGAKPRARVKGTIPPCFECPKVPENAPISSYYYASEISETTWLTIEHFDECEAVGHFPQDDPIVRRNAAIIRRIREDVKRAEQGKAMGYILGVLNISQG